MSDMNPLPKTTDLDDSDSAFNDLYQETLAPAAPALLKRRRACFRLAAVAAVVVFAAAMALFSHFHWLFARPGKGPGDYNWFSIGLFAAVLALGVLYVVRRGLVRSAVVAFREAILRPIGRSASASLDFVSNRHISAKDFEGSMLFDTITDGHGRFSGEGYFSGARNGNRFEFSALMAEKMVRLGCRIRRSRIFDGLFLVVELAHTYPGLVLAVPKSAEFNVEELAPRLEEAGLPLPKKVKSTGNHEFDRLFDAYAPDPDKAAHVFTPSLIRLLADAHNNLGVTPYLSRIGDKAYLALLTGRTHFEMPAFGTPLDLAKCRQYRDDMRLCLALAGDPAWTDFVKPTT